MRAQGISVSNTMAHRLIAGVCALALSCSIAAAQPVPSAGFTADAKTGCKVWNPNPQSIETVSWSGACANGFAQGRGKLQWLRNEQPYETDEGEWNGGRQFGIGSQVWPLGRYDGEIVNSEPSGQGTLTLKSARYDGEFRRGKPNGLGAVTTSQGTFKGTWKDGCLVGEKRKIAVGVPVSACP